MLEKLERLVAFHCAPTLMGLKAGNLISMKRAAYEAQKEQISQVTASLKNKGLCVHIFHTITGGSLLYIYREELLAKQLYHLESRRILRAFGYRGREVNGLVEQLGRRVEESGDFPHEIGLFLGYPPEDVAGFVAHKGAKCKLCGCWKVYGDVDRAQALFAQYDHCRHACCRKLQNGMRLEEVVQAG